MQNQMNKDIKKLRADSGRLALPFLSKFLFLENAMVGLR
jgi:hypothetical protein